MNFNIKKKCSLIYLYSFFNNVVHNALFIKYIPVPMKLESVCILLLLETLREIHIVDTKKKISPNITLANYANPKYQNTNIRLFFSYEIIIIITI